MKHYEVTFIVDPVLSGDEIKATAQVYEEMLKNEKYTIVHIDEMGLKQLTYPINKRSTGVYYCIEFAGEDGSMIVKLELALRRDERIMRFLTIALDKYGVKYNDDKRNGLVGKNKKKAKPVMSLGGKKEEVARPAAKTIETKAAPVAAAAVAAAPVAAPVVAPVAQEEEE